MDPVKLNHYQVATENGFWKHNRNAFQEWFGTIMTRRYCDDFIRTRLSKGDGGLDGYRLSTQTVFQVFAPREYTAAQISDKIRDDFAQAQQAIAEKKLEMKIWIFVHNDPDDLPYEAVTELAKLQADIPGIAIRRWEFTAILNEIKQPADDELVELFGGTPTLELLEGLCYQHITPVIEHLATVKVAPLPPTDPPGPRKLEYNELSEEPSNYLQRGRSKQGLVESYLLDSRRVAKTIEIGEARSREYDFQYIITMNSDQVRRKEFKPEFGFDRFWNLVQLSDENETHGLFEMRI